MVGRRVTRGTRRVHFSARRITAGAPVSPNNVTSTFLKTAHLLPKALGSNIGAPNLLLASGDSKGRPGWAMAPRVLVGPCLSLQFFS